MVEIQCITCVDGEFEKFYEQSAKESASLGGADFAILFSAVDAQNSDFLSKLNSRLGCPLIGGTSCQSVLTSNYADIKGKPSAGLMLIRDAEGDFGVGVAQLGDDPVADAKQALHSALENADCVGELPQLIWVYQAPGNEELVIEGLRSVVGDDCPIIGGSSADDDLSGQWQQFSNLGIHEDSLIVGVLFPSGSVGLAFGSGYMPTGKSGIASTTDPRCIDTIDARPAAEVYNEWTEGSLDGVPDEGGMVLDKTSLHPLGIEVGQVDSVTQYALIHPESVTPKKALRTFADVPNGSIVSAMSGSTEALKNRLGRVALEAKEYLDLANQEIAGALAIYCAGCMLSLDGELETVADSMSEALPGAPFLGAYTFGEQGHLADKNIHGNLMISVVIFGQ